MESKTKQITQKMEVDMVKLRKENQKATSSINKLREEKERVNRLLRKSQQSTSMLEEEVRLLKIEANHKQDNKKEKISANVAEVGKIKELQDRERQYSEMLKAASLKIKTYEQKIKFLQAQVNSSGGPASSRSRRQGPGSQSGANDQKFQLKIKQLETLKEKAEKASKKAQADLNGAKKDNVQLKQELNATKLKLEELERKAAKKAS
jgi:chromosome segregation ATPase